MNITERLDDHQKFKELAALAQRGALTDQEGLELNRHLQVCDSCRQAYEEYALISREGMPFLAAAFSYSAEAENWDSQPQRKQLLARIRAESEGRPFSSPGKKARVLPINHPFFRLATTQWTVTGAAICILVAVAAGAYRLGRLTPVVATQNAPTVVAHEYELITAKKSTEDIAVRQAALMSRLQSQVSSGQQEVARLRDALHAAEARYTALSAANGNKEQDFFRVSEQRDKLAAQLRDAEQAYQLVQAELTTLRSEHQHLLLRATTLESKIDDLTSSAREQERRLKDDEQYLSSDRDIRELMGARKLYIADVFDVDSGSRTRKPFGRVFYTQSKSLIFYAFDLDHQPGVKNASAFQVWGQRDTESGQKNHAMNLGILYMDSESNRRWVLRLDDPKELAQIDAVFVTVEPHGGSQKPTGKPFLYALLRKEANHP